MRTQYAIEALGVTKRFALPHSEAFLLTHRLRHPFASHSYEAQEALKDLTVQIPHGEFFGVIGPNGSGKSTFLKLIASIYVPDAGTVRISGALSPFIELGVGFNGELNARENVRLTGTLLGLTRREIDDRFDEIIAFAELERFVDQKLKNYSSGMVLRLGYALAIQVPFDILLLDEVLAVGDERFQEKCYRTLAQLREAGKTVVLVSHNLYAVASVCDRAMLLRHGAPQMIGLPRDVISLYREQEGTQDPWPENAPTFEDTKYVWGTQAGSAS